MEYTNTAYAECHNYLVGNRWHRCRQRGIRHHSDGWQLHEHRQGCHVGSKRLWQHRQISSISTHRQRRCCHRRLPRRMRNQGEIIYFSAQNSTKEFLRNLKFMIVYYFSQPRIVWPAAHHSLSWTCRNPTSLISILCPIQDSDPALDLYTQ